LKIVWGRCRLGRRNAMAKWFWLWNSPGAMPTLALSKGKGKKEKKQLGTMCRPSLPGEWYEKEDGGKS